jgi:peptidyl-prolyl cis-trans isomerase C
LQSRIEKWPERVTSDSVSSPEPAPGGPAASPAQPLLHGRWLHEPLLHFLLVGFALFVVYRALNPDATAGEAPNQITLTEDDLRQMTVAWRAQGRPPPTPEQIKSLVEAKIREEILFREALALGLDKGDTIVKRRLAQKMEFLAEDLSGIGDPGPHELKAWFEANAERFALPPRASFRHLYFSPDRRSERARDDAARTLPKLGGKPADSPAAAALADPFMFQDYYRDRSFDQLANVFGPQFAQTLLRLNPGSWQGPVESGYGWHLVWIEEMTPKRVPTFEEV